MRKIYYLFLFTAAIHIIGCSTSHQLSFETKHKQKHRRVYVDHQEKSSIKPDYTSSTDNITSSIDYNDNYTSEYEQASSVDDSIPSVKKKKQTKPDKIYLRTSEVYQVKKIFIKDSTVYFQFYYPKLDSTVRSIKKDDIEKIKYANGKTDILVNDSTPTISHEHIQSYLSRKQEPIGIIAAGLELLTIVSFIGLLILGGAGFFTVLFGLAAITLGIMSLKKIRKRPDKYKGKTLAYLSMIAPALAILFLIYIVIYLTFFW